MTVQISSVSSVKQRFPPLQVASTTIPVSSANTTILSVVGAGRLFGVYFGGGSAALANYKMYFVIDGVTRPSSGVTGRSQYFGNMSQHISQNFNTQQTSGNERMPYNISDYIEFKNSLQVFVQNADPSYTINCFALYALRK